MSRLALVAGLAIAGLLLAATWWLASSPADAPLARDAPRTITPTVSPTATATVAPATPTARPSPSPTRSPAQPDPSPTDPAATTPPADVAPPTPSPAAPPADAPPLVGSAELDDPTGDLLDSAGGRPAQSEPAADLVGVRLEGDGDELVVTWSLAGEVPASAGSLVWSLDVWAAGEPQYSLTVQQVGTRRVAGVFDWDSGEQHAPPEPVVETDTVTLRVPAALLERVDGPFQWQALGQQDGGYEDHVPAEGALAWFPSPEG